MKLLFFALIIWHSCDISYGAVFDPYTRRYNIRNASFESLFSPSTPTTTSLQTLINAAPIIDNTRCQSAYQFASTSTINQLANFQYELAYLCPQVYETAKYKNITTWGPVEEFLQIWYMRFLDPVWKKIQTRTGTCRCQLYDDFIAGALATSDTVLQQYLLANYDPALCLINGDTMYKWHLFLQRTQIKNRLNKFLRIGDFSVQLVQAIAKAYLTEARYNSYFEFSSTINEYPVLDYYNKTLSFTTYTLTQKSFIKQVKNYYKQQFDLLDFAGRQQNFLMKFSESIDLSYANFQCLNSIPLDPADGLTCYDLLLYLARKDFLIAKRLQYTSGTVTQCVVTTTTTTSKPTTTTTTIKKPTTTTTTIKPTTTTTTTAKPTTTTTTTTTPKPTTTTSTTTSTSTTTTPTTTTSTTTKPSTTTSTTTTTTTTTPTTTTTTTTAPTTSTTTTQSTTTTTPPPCPPPGTAGIVLGNGVVLDEEPGIDKATPLGTCNSPNGVMTYYNGSTPFEWISSTGDIWVGIWLRDTCATPCICTATACYNPSPGNPSIDPYLLLYPHCATPDNCFVALLFLSTGSIVNPSNPSDTYSEDEQMASGTTDVADPSYPKITRIECSGCPVMPSTTTTTPSATTTTSPSCPPRPAGAAEIFIGNGVELGQQDGFFKTDPIGTCINSTNGVITYYNGETAVKFDDNDGPVYVGMWIRDSCATPCICTATACYTPIPGSANPRLHLFPHCVTPDNCFVAVVFTSMGSLVNILNPADMFSYAAQLASGTDVTDPSYPKVTGVGCGNCPLTV